MEPRPKALTPEMQLNAARKTVVDLVAAGHVDNADAERSAAHIAKHGRLYMDGYGLAKTLDDLHSWDCNLEMAEELDNFASYARHELDQAEKEWAERTKPTPPFEIGTKVKLRTAETGEITGVYDHAPAKYLVKIDGDVFAASCKSRRIVNFEDVLAGGEGV